MSGPLRDWKEARYAKERERMVEDHLVRRGIIDARVLDVMRQIPRHLFVDEALRERAYGDHPLPIGEGQTISQPYMVALMAQLLHLAGTEKVLEIGTGSGYQTAVIASLARRVFSIERLPMLAERARRTLERLGFTNVLIRVADGTLGWPDELPFDRIVVAAGAPEAPEPLLKQLAQGGQLVIPIGSHSSQTLHVIERVGDEFRVKMEAGCVFVKLVGKYGWNE
jgi:protein-L-isoaspartate(D-aspartate) O-methyltransferase